MITVAQKAQFLTLASRLSPENLTCDGEIRGRAVSVRRNKIVAEWRALEKTVGRKVSEDETYGWYAEVAAYEKAERVKEEARLALETIGGMEHRNENVWSLKGKNGMSAFYIQNYGPDDPYILYSEFANYLHNKEKIGSFPTLEAAYDAGMRFLKTVTFESLQKANPQYHPNNIERALQRLPA